jgi:prevent-host-death family protein
MAEARRRLPDLLRAAQREPQILYRRDEPIGAVVSASELDRLDVSAAPGSIAEAFVELRSILTIEGETLEGEERGEIDLVVPERRNRPNPFADDVG